MKLIVGLGNPGNEYKNTRHNVGFNLIDYICKQRNLNIDKEQFNAKYAVTRVDGERVLMIKPLSYMNLSGVVVKKYVDYFKLNNEDVLVIQDDIDMPLGRVKIITNSSSGGHNGIKDIERNLKGKNYVRLKIGIGKDSNIDSKDYVLSKFSDEELEKLNVIYSKLESIVDDFCLISYDRMMNKYNKRDILHND